MGLISGKHRSTYYTGQGDAFGSYQFTSLENIINQFIVAYVGENKIIPKVSKLDVAFHAQRALAELSFDTFKSIKAQEIILPPTLTMILPQDYVNYTKISTVDSAGIKHPLIKTNSTSNPFSIKQEENGDYFFEDQYVNIINGDFDQPLGVDWLVSTGGRKSGAWDGLINAGGNYPNPDYINDTIGVVGSELEFAGLWRGAYHGNTGGAYGAWQRIDVSTVHTMNLSANGQSAAKILDTSGVVLCDFGIVRIGLTTTNPSVGWPSQGASGLLVSADKSNTAHLKNPSPNQYAEYLDLGYLEWNDGSVQTKELEDIDVTALDEVWVYIQSQAPWNQAAVELAVWTNENDVDPVTGDPDNTPKQWAPNASTNNTPSKNKIDSVTLTVGENNPNLTHSNADRNSNAFTNYKSVNPSENNSDDYQDETYWPMEGSRYGLDPQHAQVNGSFYLDERFGKINFSSNIAGKTVILDYISDSLGTDGEMQVHKLAEEAMYKCIAHAIISTSSYGQQLAPRFKKEKFAAVRQAKLRLSSVKLDELTQILRGKSKQIKH
tara:strand:- start:1339 stop:2985 length:1647 start_codon:yes stop_codon:yes gene_type:complete